jgi:DNA-binding Lrp family transcriptional regulator
MDHSEETKVDATDYRILRELVRDGRASDVNLSDRVHLSSTATARRRKILEEQGIVRGYAATLDVAQLGFSIVVLISIELVSQAELILKEFESAVLNCPSMSFCGFVSGAVDFIMIVHVKSFADYDRVYRRELSNLPHVAKIRSSFVMREVANRPVAPAVLKGE